MRTNGVNESKTSLLATTLKAFILNLPYMGFNSLSKMLIRIRTFFVENKITSQMAHDWIKMSIPIGIFHYSDYSQKISDVKE